MCRKPGRAREKAVRYHDNVRLHQIPLDPNWTLLLFAAAILLIYWEMCRPGMILPGIGGLTLAILCAIKLAAAPRHSLNPWVAVPVIFALALITGALAWLAAQSYLHKRAL